MVSQKMKHTPHALRRSVLAEIEQVYADDHRRTQFSRFRSPGDLSVTSSLHHYYAYHTARATIGRIRYDYVDLSDRAAQRRMNRILAARSLDTFCINDTVVTEDRGRRGEALRQFLGAYFPVPSPYELPGGGAPVEPTALVRDHEWSVTA
ncbi:stealth conserved region 3 domain-containing protein [Streptacidiphilus monticola]